MSDYTDAGADEFSEETGLNLFDDRASAAGSFPHAMMGYDRSSVDNYVRDLERRLAAARQLNRDRLRDLESLKAQQGTTDFTGSARTPPRCCAPPRLNPTTSSRRRASRPSGSRRRAAASRPTCARTPRPRPTTSASPA